MSGINGGEVSEQNSRELTIPLVHINEFFLCSLCNGYLRDPYTIKECMHTFCNGCIRQYFTANAKNIHCPRCLQSLSPKPWSKILPDPVIRDLLCKFLPDFGATEEEEMKEFYANLGIKRKRAYITDAKKEIPRKIPRNELVPKTRFVLRPLLLRNNELKALDVPDLISQSDLKIMYLRKYLVKKLNVEMHDSIEILCRNVPLGMEHSLEFVRRSVWGKSAKMVLQYRLKRAARGIHWLPCTESAEAQRN